MCSDPLNCVMLWAFETTSSVVVSLPFCNDKKSDKMMSNEAPIQSYGN